MRREFARAFYSSGAWKRCRKDYAKSVGFWCEECLERGVFTMGDEVHHVIALTPENINDPSISLNLDNLVSLCRECHQKRHGAHARRYELDDLGRVRIK